jgi:hypothetical protein
MDHVKVRYEDVWGGPIWYDYTGNRRELPDNFYATDPETDTEVIVFLDKHFAPAQGFSYTTKNMIVLRKDTLDLILPHPKWLTVPFVPPIIN